MASRKEDVDLFLVLTDPKCARQYIKDFNWSCPPEWIPDKVDLGTRVITFRDMSDEDAVVAAMAILRDVQIPLEMKEKHLQYWEQ